MPDPITALKVVGGGLGAGLIGGKHNSPAKDAAEAQERAAQLGIDETARQFNETKASLSPFVNAGTNALNSQLNLLGLNGNDAQGAAYNNIQSSPIFQGIAQQGNDAILANAAATGGLRGGDVQSALAKFQPALLQQFIQQQYGNLSGLSGAGQSAASGAGALGSQSSTNISNLLQNQGRAEAGGIIGKQNEQTALLNSVLSIFGGLNAGQQKPLGF